MTQRRVLVPIANGSEEIESVCIIDTLRRAGADVTGNYYYSLIFIATRPHLQCAFISRESLSLTLPSVASVEETREVTCARSTKIVADALIGECTHTIYDLIALPGLLSLPSPIKI